MNFEKIYDKQVKEKFFSDYEFWRWFKDDQAKLGYDQTKQALEKVFLNQNLIFSNYLEFGPGPGTWTKFFLDKKSGANFTLVDISNEMLSLAKQNLS
ncbi:MAG: class I SAM-dependent methyltransferase, partial [Candidatus Paceibacterota bacterium]